MRQLLLSLFLLTNLSAMAVRPSTEERLAENNFFIVSDMYEERPVWIKSYHCDRETITRTLMNNPQIVIEREFDNRLICRMNDVQLVRISDSSKHLPTYMSWTATLYFTVEIWDDEYQVELREAVWNGVRELLDDVDYQSYTLYDCFFNNRGNIDSLFLRNRAEALNDRLTAIFAPRL